jgi:fatty acyl-ACP thioesterase A
MVEMETWFQEAGKIGAQRDWEVRDTGSGEVLGRATSTWVMINMHTRRLSKMPDPVRRRCGWYQLSPPRNAIPAEYTRAKIPDLELPPQLVGPQQVARRSDMDMNGHINNVTYLAWALETIPPDVAHGCHLYQLEVDYKAECHAGDLVDSLAADAQLPPQFASNGAGPGALTYVHMLRRCEGEACTELVRARTTWRAGETQ